MRKIRTATRQDLAPFVLDIHYAGRWPSISYAYALYKDGIEGIVTYGTPPSAPLKTGICGPEFAAHVIELNRLCLRNNKRNDASWLVSHSLRAIPGDKIVVSFADISQGHNGAVYRACNFLYCGLSAKRTDWKVKGREHLHGQTVADEFRGQPNRAQAMRDKYGEDFYLEPRPRKHRYVTFIGSRKFKKAARFALRYAVQEFVR